MQNSINYTSFFTRHRAAMLVLSSQIAAALLHAVARIVETGLGLREQVHHFTVLQIRLFITVLGYSTYLWRTNTSLLGPPKLRPLLALRAVGGVFGACGFYSRKEIFNSASRAKLQVSISDKPSVNLIFHTQRSYSA